MTKTVTVKVDELEGRALSWAIAEFLPGEYILDSILYPTTDEDDQRAISRVTGNTVEVPAMLMEDKA